MTGPLEGLRIVELAGLGPGPFCAMVLADLGAEVVKVERPRPPVAGALPGPSPRDVLQRGRRSVGLDLKHPEGADALLELLGGAHGLIEGFRPGVMERLGLGPDVVLARNHQLVYGRMTGWGQDGPYAQMAGHDINYIALAGALDPIGRKGKAPVPPLNLVGDFGGGGMLLALGMVAALLHVERGGSGQVVDAAMVDGAALLTTMFHAFRAMGAWNDERGSNVLDTGAHFYDAYETADGKYVAVGSIEPQFYAELLRLLGIDATKLPRQNDRAEWDSTKERIAAVFRTRTRAEWCDVMDGTDACVAPVLGLGEAPSHPHNVHRATFVELDGVVQPAPAPRFSATPLRIQRPPAHPGEHTVEVLREWGLDAARISALREAGAIA